MKSKTFTRNNIVTWLSRCMPNAEQMTWITLDAEEIRFEWRGATFKVTVEPIFVEEVDGMILSGSDKAMLIEALLKKQFVLECMA